MINSIFEARPVAMSISARSVAHDTDFANAGTGRGDPRNLVEPIKLAATMARPRDGVGTAL